MSLPRRAALTSSIGAAAWLALRACTARAEAGPLFLICRVHPALGAGVARVDGHAAATAHEEHRLLEVPGAAR